MTFEIGLGLLVAAIVLVYGLWALIRPEHF